MDDATVAAWYEAHPDDYRREERVAIEYITLDAEGLDVPDVDEATLQARYDDAGERFAENEERLASHILVQVDSDTTDAQARAEATRLAGLANEPGADFAALAREHSDDVGSRATGGDLGWITRGTMGDAFDQALFALKPGATSAPVKTDFGWHVIRLREVTPGARVPFEEVRGQLAAEAAAEAREMAFNELAGQVVDEVYTNPGDLSAAAEIAGVEVRTTGLFARGEGSGVAANPGVQRLAFSEALVEDGLVSDPVEVASGQTVLLRVVEHQPERVQPLEDVRDQVVAAIRQARVEEQLEEQARAFAAGLVSTGDLAAAAEMRGLPLAEQPQMQRGMPVASAEAVDAMFAVAPPEEGKVSAGYVVDNGVALVFAVRSVTAGEVPPVDDPQRLMLANQLAQLAGNDEAEAYVAALRDKVKVVVAEDRL